MSQSGFPKSEAGLARVTYLPGARPPEGGFDDAADRGDEISTEINTEVESVGEAAARASNISMHALTRRGLSSTEMRRLLLSRELPDSMVDAEVDRLERVGLLDDSALAEALVRTLRDRKGLGRSALTAELKRRHLPGDAIQAALDPIDTEDEVGKASELAFKRAPQLRSLDGETARRRLVAFLMRKGYSGTIAGAAAAMALPSSRSGSRFE